MTDIKKKILIFAGIFFVTVIVTLIATRSKSEETISYTVLGDSTLPVIKIAEDVCDINCLYGYTVKTQGSQAQYTLTPVGKDNKIKIKVYNPGEIITGIFYEIRSIDGENLISSDNLESWKSNPPYLTAEIPIIDIIDSGIQYQLIIKLRTEKSGDISYFTRIIRSSDIKLNEMLGYVRDLHEAALNPDKADAYAVNWEPNGSLDDTDLSFVSIHSGFRNFTYKNLNPVQEGECVIDILELDNTMGAFRVKSEIKTALEDGTENTYSISEYVSVQWSTVRFYLMDYERTMSQIFKAGPETITARGLNFGINAKDNMEMMFSDNKTGVAFINGGSLWTYSTENGEINEIFSFITGQELIYRLHGDYKIRILSVSDDGNVSFVVQGYMARGIHEGETGLSLYNYIRETNQLKEIIYMPSEKSPQIADLTLDALCKKIGNLTYILFNNTLFAIDENGSEIIRMVENAAAHNFIVSDDQMAAAWSQGPDTGYPSQIQVKYFDTGETASYEAENGSYVLPKGFVDGDSVIVQGSKEDEGTDGIAPVAPMKKIIVMDKTGRKVSAYERDGIYVCEVTASPGKIDITRLVKENGIYKFIDADTLMQNDMEYKKEVSPYTYYTDEIKGKICRLDFSAEDGPADYSAVTPGQVSYFEERITGTESDEHYYYAYVGGEIRGRFLKASDAIKAVYDKLGYVTDDNGHRIWHRSPKATGKVQISIPENTEPQEPGNELAGCTAALLTKAGAIADAKSILQEKDVISAINENAPGPAVLLSGCTLRQISYYIDRICPVLIVDENDTAFLMTGYDQSNVYYYDSVTGKTHSMSASDMEKILENRNTRVVTYVKK